MPQSEEETETVEVKTYDVRVTISSLGNERRVVKFDDCDEDKVREIVRTINSAFEVIRKSQALTLVGTDGVSVFANLDNVAFIEVHVG